MMSGLMQVITAIKAVVCCKAAIPASTFHRFTTVAFFWYETFHVKGELDQCGSQGFPVFVEPFLAHFVRTRGSGQLIIVIISRRVTIKKAWICLFALFHAFHTTVLLLFQRQSRRKLNSGFSGFIWPVYHFEGGKSFPFTRPKIHSLSKIQIWRLLWAV